jgi:hypothetical protein
MWTINRGLTIPLGQKETTCCEMLLKASDFVNTLMKLELHKMRDISRLAA